MLSLIKKVAKTAVIASIAVGGVAGAAVLVAGPDRTKAVVGGVHEKVLSSIDAAIEDPAVLRGQLQKLEREYPKRIGAVRGDLAELRAQIRQLEREREISARVVELADADVEELRSELAAAGGDGVLASVRSRSVSSSPERARSRLVQAQRTRAAYAGRVADAEHDLGYLVKQESRLEELLSRLEAERAAFQAQIQQLTRQVDAIARNERLIELLDQRNKTIEECSRYQVASLDQLTSRLAEIKSRQEAELDYLAGAERQVDYEDVARMQIAEEEAAFGR